MTDNPNDQLEKIPYQEKIEQFADFIYRAHRIAVLTGAGISTESGIPDFRSPNGIYKTGISEEIFDIGRFEADPENFYRTLAPMWQTIFSAVPNPGHLALAQWETFGKEITIATQNIDDLHRKAGSSTVFELHGCMRTLTCLECGRLYESTQFQTVLTAGTIPQCGCGGCLKPDITFYGENLPEGALLGAEFAFESADLALVLGTSLGVYPAASLPHLRGRNVPLVIVNQSATPLDSEAALVLPLRLGNLLTETVRLLKR